MSGELYIQHANSMKSKGEYLISFGQSIENHGDSVDRHILFR